MFHIRVVISLLLIVAFLPRTLAGQYSSSDSGQYDGRVKALRIYARGPDGRERMFEYREGSTVDGSHFRSWGSGDWGNERWSGRWESGGYNGGNDGDSGQYVILSAQYGTARRHLDVSNRLKELAPKTAPSAWATAPSASIQITEK